MIETNKEENMRMQLLQSFTQAANQSAVVITDNAVLGTFVRLVLWEIGVQVDVVANAEEFDTLLRSSTPDIIFADWDNDGVDGRTILKNTQLSHSELVNVPAIVMTNRALSTHDRQALSRQYRWVLCKPLVASLLPKLVHFTMNHKRIALTGGRISPTQFCNRRALQAAG